MARLPNEDELGGEANPKPPILAAAVPSPKTFPEEVEPNGLLKEGAEPKLDGPPNAGEPPKVGGLPNTGALPNPSCFVGVENEPKPCWATEPAPVLNAPLGFCSPNELEPKPLLLPNRPAEPVLTA